MGELIFMRHGQASFGQKNYDVLSKGGEEQAVLAAQYLLTTNLAFTNIYTGTLNRQIDTARATLAYLDSHTNHSPSFIQNEGLNEYPFGKILNYYLPRLIASDKSLQNRLENAFTDEKALQFLFDLVIDNWLTDDALPAEVESWPRFKERVEKTINHIISTNEKDSRILIFSSGGVISTVLHLATGMSPHDAIRTGWGLVNTSFSKFRFGSSGLTLHTFNSYPHLKSYQGGKLITYR